MIRVGDHVQKKTGFKFVGTVLAVFVPRNSEEWYAVVELDKSEASDGLQHIYKLDQLEPYGTKKV
jgi:hypothetical protein